MSVQFFIPVKTVSEANYHEHWRARQKRAKNQRSAAFILTTQEVNGFDAPRIKIKLTRHGIGKLDSDNLAGSQKHIRDGIAAALGIDDGSDRLEWQYAQIKCKRGECGTQVEINEV